MERIQQDFAPGREMKNEMAGHDVLETKRSIRFQVLLLALHLFAAGGLLLVLEFGNPRYAGLYGYVASALLVFDILYYFPRLKEFRTRVSTARLFDARVLYGLFFLSVTVVALAGKGVLYYLVVTVLVLMLIYSTVLDGVTVHRITVLFITSITLLVGEASTGSFYFAYFDTISHTNTIADVSRANDLQPVEYARGHLPSLFLLGGVAVEIFGSETRWTMAMLTAVGIQTVGLVVFTFASRFGFARTTGFVGYSLVVVSPSFLDFGTRVHPQTLSLILFSMFALVSMLSDRTRRQFLLLPIIVTWMLSHQASLLIGAFLFLPFSVYLYSLGKDGPAKSLFLLGIIVTAYWVVLTMLVSAIAGWLLFTNPQVNAAQTRLLIPTVESPLELLHHSMPYYLSSTYRSFWLALAGMGTYSVFHRYGWSNRFGVVLSLCIPAGWAFFPNPGWIGIQDVLILQRWNVMALPLVVILPAIGLRSLVRETTSPRGVVVGFVVALLLFTSLSSGFTDPSLTGMAGDPKEIRHYLTDQDVSSIEFVSTHVEGEVETSLSYAQYMVGTGMTQEGHVVTVSGGGTIVDSNRPVLLPEAALHDHGIKVRIRTDGDVQYMKIVDEVDQGSPSTRNRVYTNGGAILYQ